MWTVFVLLIYVLNGESSQLLFRISRNNTQFDSSTFALFLGHLSMSEMPCLGGLQNSKEELSLSVSVSVFVVCQHDYVLYSILLLPQHISKRGHILYIELGVCLQCLMKTDRTGFLWIIKSVSSCPLTISTALLVERKNHESRKAQYFYVRYSISWSKGLIGEDREGSY